MCVIEVPERGEGRVEGIFENIGQEFFKTDKICIITLLKSHNNYYEPQVEKIKTKNIYINQGKTTENKKGNLKGVRGKDKLPFKSNNEHDTDFQGNNRNAKAME